MLVSGHSMRLMHLRHHARPLADDDLEGQGALRSFLGALAAGPANALALRLESWRVGNASQRRWMLAETVTSLLLLTAAVAVGPMAFKVWAATCVTMQLTASAWASHLPHHPPAVLRRIALALAWTGSATMLSFAFHAAHHAAPKVPCRNLANV
jgi:fatty acid desaturase